MNDSETATRCDSRPRRGIGASHPAFGDGWNSKKRGIFRRSRRLLFLAGALGAMPSTADAQTGPTTEGLQLQPGDVIRAEVWRESDLSGDFLIDPSGDVVLPLLGIRHVTGQAWEDVKERLLESYARELRNPSIELTPLRRVFVLGEVTEPGMYALEPTLTLAGAIAMAGGARPEGDLRRLQLMRNGSTVLDGVSVEHRLVEIDVRSGDQILVDRRSWLDRNSTFIASALLSVTSILVTLASR